MFREPKTHLVRSASCSLPVSPRFPLASLLVPIVALTFAGVLAAADAPQNFGERIDVSAVELNIDVRDAHGNTPTDLKPEDFVVLEDGKPQRVIGLDSLASLAPPPAPAGAAPRVATGRPVMQSLIYFDMGMSSWTSVTDAAKKLSQSADALTALGSVEVVVVRSRPEILLEPTRDPAAVRAAMAKVLQHPMTLHEIDLIRRAYADLSQPTGTPAFSARVDGGVEARFAAQQELYILRRHRQELINYLGRYDDRSPKALFFVNDGFDLSPLGRYASLMPDLLNTPGLLGDMSDLDEGKRYDDFLEDIAARHWTAFPIASGYLSGSADSDVTSRREANLTRFGLSDSLSAMYVLQRAAQLIGGAVLLDPRKIVSTVDGIGQRYRLTYQFDHPVDNRLHKVEVKSLRAGLTVHAPQRTRIATNQELAAARAKSLLIAPYEKGELGVRCAVSGFKNESLGKRTANLTIVADATALGAFRSRLDDTQLRYSVAVSGEGDEMPFLSQQTLKRIDLAKDKGYIYELPLRFKSKSKRVAVVVEELTSGAWGSCVGPLKAEAVAAR